MHIGSSIPKISVGRAAIKISGIVLLLLPFLLYSQGMERPSMGDRFYFDEDYRFLSRGSAPNFFSSPYSRNKSKSYRPPDKSYYINPDISFSLRLHSFTGDISDGTESYWYNHWLCNDPLVLIGFQTGNENFVIDTRFDLRQDFFNAFHSDHLWNIPPTFQDYDYNFPTRGYIAYGNKNLQLLVGRDKISWGPGRRSNMMLSSTVPYFDQINLSYQNRVFKGTFVFIPLESYLKKKEKNTVNEALENELTPEGHFEKDMDQQSKFITGHRFEFKPLESLIIGFNDILVVGGRFPNFEDIPPTMFYHNIYGENYSNVMIGFDTWWTILPGLAVYGEFIIDDIRNTLEGSYTVPTSLGGLGGVQYLIPSSRSRIVSTVEFGMTGPYTYERWHPYTNFYSRRKLLSTSMDSNEVIDTATGMFLGSDALYITLWLDCYRARWKLSGGWEFWKTNPESHLIGVEIIEHYNESPDRDYDYTNIIFCQGSFVLNDHLRLGYRETLMLGDEAIHYLSLSLTVGY